MSLAFCFVDTVNDFFKGGKLEVPGADGIRDNLLKLTRKACSHSIPIIHFNDWHPENAEEFKVFPPHCIQGTEGAELIEEVKLADEYTCNVGRSINEIFLHRQDVQAYRFFKNTYDIFDEKEGNPNVDMFLKKKEITDVIIAGLIDELCVNAAVLGFLDRNIKTHIVVDGTMYLNEYEFQKCKLNWFCRGAYFTKTDIITL